MIQINSRQKFLVRFLGAKPKEDISHARANEVNLWITLTTSLFCVLEIVLYFIYNRMVHPWLPIINGIKKEDEGIEMVEESEKNKHQENNVEAMKEEEKEKKFRVIYDWKT